MENTAKTDALADHSQTVIYPAVRELMCQACQKEYTTWYTHNDLWNKVVRDGEHFFCPTCFGNLAVERGHDFGIWKLTIKNVESHQDALDSIPIYNRPHSFRDTGVLLNIDCAVCDRRENDTIHV